MLQLISECSYIVLGFVYPAYCTFHVLTAGRAHRDALAAWCKYWMQLGLLHAFLSVIRLFAPTLLVCAMQAFFPLWLWHRYAN